jgi:hypothetical protein
LKALPAGASAFSAIFVARPGLTGVAIGAAIIGGARRISMAVFRSRETTGWNPARRVRRSCSNAGAACIGPSQVSASES